MTLDALGSLVQPLETATFLARHWEKQPLFLERNDAKRFASIFSVDAIDELLALGSLAYPSVRAFHAGRNIWPEEFTRSWAYGNESHDDLIDPRKIRALLASGATINFRGLERYWPPVVTLNRAIEKQFGFPTHSTAFLTPPSADNIPVHYDTVDGFMLQVSGTKRWQLWQNDFLWPLNEQDHQSRGCVVRDSNWIGEFDLTPGSVLYVPRGCIHQAITLDSHSLHLVIGINACRRLDVIAAAVRRATDALQSMPRFRRALPARCDVRDRDAEYRSAVEDAARVLRRSVSLRGATNLLDEDILTWRSPVRFGQIPALDAIDRLSSHDHLQLRNDAHFVVERGNALLNVRAHGHRVSLSVAAEPALRRILMGIEFRVRELPGLSAPQQLRLVSQLVRLGLLRFHTPLQAERTLRK